MNLYYMVWFDLILGLKPNQLEVFSFFYCTNIAVWFLFKWGEFKYDFKITYKLPIFNALTIMRVLERNKGKYSLDRNGTMVLIQVY